MPIHNAEAIIETLRQQLAEQDAVLALIRSAAK